MKNSSWTLHHQIWWTSPVPNSDERCLGWGRVKKYCHKQWQGRAAGWVKEKLPSLMDTWSSFHGATPHVIYREPRTAPVSAVATVGKILSSYRHLQQMEQTTPSLLCTSTQTSAWTKSFCAQIPLRMSRFAAGILPRCSTQWLTLFPLRNSYWNAYLIINIYLKWIIYCIINL